VPDTRSDYPRALSSDTPPGEGEYWEIGKKTRWAYESVHEHATKHINPNNHQNNKRETKAYRLAVQRTGDSFHWQITEFDFRKELFQNRMHTHKLTKAMG
jgi:ribosomal protein L18